MITRDKIIKDIDFCVRILYKNSHLIWSQDYSYRDCGRRYKYCIEGLNQVLTQFKSDINYSKIISNEEGILGDQLIDTDRIIYNFFCKESFSVDKKIFDKFTDIYESSETGVFSEALYKKYMQIKEAIGSTIDLGGLLPIKMIEFVVGVVHSLKQLVVKIEEFEWMQVENAFKVFREAIDECQSKLGLSHKLKETVYEFANEECGFIYIFPHKDVYSIFRRMTNYIITNPFTVAQNRARHQDISDWIFHPLNTKDSVYYENSIVKHEKSFLEQTIEKIESGFQVSKELIEDMNEYIINIRKYSISEETFSKIDTAMSHLYKLTNGVTGLGVDKSKEYLIDRMNEYKKTYFNDYMIRNYKVGA